MRCHGLRPSKLPAPGCCFPDSLRRYCITRAGFPFAGDYARDNPVYHVHIDLLMRPPLPPSNTVTMPADLPAGRPPDRLPSTMAALAAIPEEEIWLQSQKSARTRRNSRLPISRQRLRLSEGAR
jgi:hypothetical protein